jgi:hypothetical protein
MRTLQLDGSGNRNQDRSIQPSAIVGELPPRALTAPTPGTGPADPPTLAPVPPVTPGTSVVPRTRPPRRAAGFGTVSGGVRRLERPPSGTALSSGRPGGAIGGLLPTGWRRWPVIRCRRLLCPGPASCRPRPARRPGRISGAVALITNDTVVTADASYAADVLIDGETIVQIGSSLVSAGVTADETIDATDRYVIPGGIDAHTHMELPFGGTFAKDTFETGTRAAAFGGTTSIIDFAVQPRGN